MFDALRSIVRAVSLVHPSLRSVRWRVPIITVVASLTATSAALSHATVEANRPKPSIVDIGGFGRTAASAAFGIANGLAVGFAQTAGSNGRPNAVSSRGAGLTDIGAGLFGTQAAAVNAAGVAVGQAFLPGQAQQQAIAFTGGREINLGVLPGDASSFATAIDSEGEIVGVSNGSTSAYFTQAFVYESGKLRGIPQLRALSGYFAANARGINDSGAIVGNVGQKGGFATAVSSYVLDGDKVTLFGTVYGNGFGNSQATAINAAGVVVGYRSTFSFSANAPLHAYSYRRGTLTDLGTLYPTDFRAVSIANAINKQGIVVGYSQLNFNAAPRATVFAKGAVTDLNALLPANSGWVLEIAEGIDDLGNIVGIGLHDSVQRGFILHTGSAFTIR